MSERKKHDRMSWIKRIVSVLQRRPKGRFDPEAEADLHPDDVQYR